MLENEAINVEAAKLLNKLISKKRVMLIKLVYLKSSLIFT